MSPTIPAGGASSGSERDENLDARDGAFLDRIAQTYGPAAMGSMESAAFERRIIARTQGAGHRLVWAGGLAAAAACVAAVVLLVLPTQEVSVSASEWMTAAADVEGAIGDFEYDTIYGLDDWQNDPLWGETVEGDDEESLPADYRLLAVVLAPDRSSGGGDTTLSTDSTASEWTELDE